ncbi:transketolase family protein [Roseateles sp. BYS78W]|uniref:Transketolase family protein n=1 Tax=Pelomonas candidula TaxID=3299025 RepID=A0ABW7HA63_9BURK
MRNAFIQELVSLARQHPQIALIVGDLGYSVIEPFADEFPDRFINAGVAEQNMTGLAAGMASEGYHVFTYSIANFPTFRCAEQIRNDVAYHRLPVTVVSVGGGLAYGALGYSHHAVQDYALMRTLPGMLIAAPGDPMEVRACMRYLVEHPGPSYLRLGKAGEPNFHAAPPDVAPGRWLKLRDGTGRSVLLSTGAGLQIAMDWVQTEEHAARSVYSMPLWSMASKASQAALLADYDDIVTVEDHLEDGGFGSWLLESQAMNTGISCRIRPIALNHVVCGTVGSQATLNRIGGIVP